MGPDGSVPPIEISAGSFLPGTLPSRRFLLRLYSRRPCILPDTNPFRLFAGFKPCRILQGIPTNIVNTH